MRVEGVRNKMIGPAVRPAVATAPVEPGDNGVRVKVQSPPESRPWPISSRPPTSRPSPNSPR